jgi:two-component system response regulator ChvI
MQAVPDVLLVDDDDDFREVLSADLADRGFEVRCFADGPSLLEALGSGTDAHVALLDWSLPQMSGFELLDALRKRGIGLPVVFLTGHARVERELEALGHGAVDFVDKARGTEVLAHRLRVIIEGQRQLPRARTPATEHHGALVLLPETARALWRQRDVGLTLTEYRIVALLASREGAFQTYREIYDVAHYAGFTAGSGEHGFETNVRSLLKRIRRKFLAVDPGFSAIENAHGVGYRWRGHDSPAPA